MWVNNGYRFEIHAAVLGPSPNFFRAHSLCLSINTEFCFQIARSVALHRPIPAEPETAIISASSSESSLLDRSERDPEDASESVVPSDVLRVKLMNAKTIKIYCICGLKVYY